MCSAARATAWGVLVGCSLAAPALGCTCAWPGTAADALARSEAVFVGEALAADRPFELLREYRDRLRWTVYEHWGGSPPERDWARVRYVFEVREVWKGDLADHLAVHTGTGGGDCGAYFEVGETYLVFAGRGEGGRYVTGICSRTRELAAAYDDLLVLGPGRPAQRSLSGGQPRRLLALAVLLVALGLAARAWSRSRFAATPPPAPR